MKKEKREREMMTGEEKMRKLEGNGNHGWRKEK